MVVARGYSGGEGLWRWGEVIGSHSQVSLITSVFVRGSRAISERDSRVPQ